LSQGGITDHTGPEIRPYLNDDRLVNGSITHRHPFFFYIFDFSGINTGSSGINHHLMATLDNNNRYFILNNFYETELDDYQKGVCIFNCQQFRLARIP
jgi:hypothetical protein